MPRLVWEQSLWVDQFNFSDKLAMVWCQCSIFFHMLSTSKCLISVEEVQSCIFQLHLFICCSLMCGISKHESHCHLFELEPCFVCYNNASQKEILVRNNTNKALAKTRAHKAMAKMCGQYNYFNALGVGSRTHMWCLFSSEW